MLAEVVSDTRAVGASDRLANTADSADVITSCVGFRWPQLLTWLFQATPREEKSCCFCRTITLVSWQELQAQIVIGVKQ